MIDREKIIRGLECCGYMDRPNCADCPEDGPGLGYACRDDLMKKALTLLKAQKPDEDWISRKRLRDEIQYYIEEAGWGDEVNKVLGWCLEFIDNQEAVKWE